MIIANYILLLMVDGWWLMVDINMSLEQIFETLMSNHLTPPARFERPDCEKDEHRRQRQEVNHAGQVYHPPREIH